MRAPVPSACGQFPPDRDRLGRLCSGQHHRQRLVLVRQLTFAGRIHVTDLEQLHAASTVRLVVGDRLQQTGPQRRAQHALVGDERVRHPEGGGGQTGALQHVGAEERVRHRLGDPEAEQHLADEPATLLAHAQSTVDHRFRHGLAEALVAVVAGDLLDHVDLGGRVRAPGRQRNQFGGHAVQADSRSGARRPRSPWTTTTTYLQLPRCTSPT